MVEVEAGRALDVVVPPVTEGIMGADDDLHLVGVRKHDGYLAQSGKYSPEAHILAAAWQLDRSKLLLVVLLERWTEAGNNLGGRYRESLDVCERGS